MINPAHNTLRRLIWLYMFLWLVEGALRFWVLPSLGAPLLLVRDPVVILIYLTAMQARMFPVNGFVVSTLVLAVVSLPLAILWGHGNIGVALFGFRANFLHLPLIFVIGRAWTILDMSRLVRIILWITLPMTFLAVRQFQSPASAPINMGGMSTHYGTVRPAGTFSFVSAMVQFVTLSAAIVAYRFLRPPRTWGWVTIAAGVCVVLMVTVSGSRTAVVSVGVIVFLAMAAGVSKVRRASGLAFGIAIVGMVAALIANAEFAQEGTEQLQKRFEDASGGSSLVETIWDRFADTTIKPWSSALDRNLFGEGIGWGTNVGGIILTQRRNAFLGGEGEWDRLLTEMGPFLGALFIFVRAALVWRMGRLAWTRGVLKGDSLMVLFFGAAWLPVLAGQWGVPSLQGFASIAAGLFFAAFRMSSFGRRSPRYQTAFPALTSERGVG